MKITVCYVHLSEDARYIDLASRFVATYNAYPPGLEHETLIICNYSPANDVTRALFSSLPSVRYHNRDNEGWDIGGYLEVSKQLDSDFMVCFGSSTHFNRGNWLVRMRDVWTQEGPGLYAPFGSFEVRPHLRTIGFWCRPQLLAMYPHRIHDKASRYFFEHGQDGLTEFARRHLVKTRMVTWDGVWDQNAWRYPSNIFRRGDQLNCLIWDNHTEMWANANHNDKMRLAQAAG